MGDSIQEQLNKLFALLLAKQQANKSQHEKVEQLHAKMDTMSQYLEIAKQRMSFTGAASQTKTRKDKGISGAAIFENSEGNSIVPKFTKLDFPRFNGLEDPLGWLSRCEHFFRHLLTPEDEKVSLASYHLEGIAQLWYMQMLQDGSDLVWEEFKHQSNLQFGPPIQSNKLGELAKLKQLGTVVDIKTSLRFWYLRLASLLRIKKSSFTSMDYRTP